MADLPPEEIQRATKKNDRQDARIAKSGGVTSRSRALAAEWHPLLDARLRTVLKARSDDPDLSVFLDRASKLGCEKLSACILQGALQDIQHEKNTYLKAALRVGQNIYLECFAAGLFKGYPKRLAQTIKRQNKGKPNRIRALVARELYKMPDWSEGHLAKAGTWGIDQLCAAIPDAFGIEERNIKIGSNKQALEKILQLTPDAIEGAERSVAELIRRSPLWLPKPEAPSKWEDWTKGGTSDHRLDGTLSIVRSRNNYTARAVSKAIRDGTMRPTLDALNALQAVRWKINRPVLDVLRACDLQKIKVDGLPKSSISDRVVFIADIETAQELTAHDCFYTAMNLDWRGQVYGVPHFNFQRDDRVRALFLFADGEPIGAEGLNWLKVHIANCGDFDKISKRSFDERLWWVADNIEKIKANAEAPLEQRWWTEADKPFQFLAACKELTAALKEGPAFVSRLPVSFDGSCSGLQHLSAMMRDEKTAPLVNLTAHKRPKDVYEAVARIVNLCVENNVDAEDGHLAQLWLNHGIDRKVVKRNVMSFFYGSNDYSMKEQLCEDVMQRYAADVANGDREKHPFENESDAAAEYLARQAYLTIKNNVRSPAKAMAFLQEISDALSKANLFPKWTTPAGFPWANRYYKYKSDQIRLHLTSLEMSFRVSLATGEEPEVRKRKAADAIAANFVHACDAAHLMLTVNAAVSEGITSIATVHDCFGCLPSRAERFRKIIREQFVRMYDEHDVLAKVLEQARKDLNEPNTKRMPSAPPSRGSFDIKNVLDAEFAFA